MPKRLIIDVDGVLADVVRATLTELNRELGTSFRKPDIKQWDQPLGPTNIKDEVERRLLDPRFVQRVPTVQGAAYAYSFLLCTYDITIATSRDPRIDDATQAWLARKHFPYTVYENVCGRSKSELDGDILIDDYHGNVAAFVATGRPAILFSQPWNENPLTAPLPETELITRAHSWYGLRWLLAN
jgi:5'-nucleotidase